MSEASQPSPGLAGGRANQNGPDSNAASAADAGPIVQHSAELAHATVGRVRLKVPAAKNNPALLNQIRTAFEGHAGIDAVSIKPASGSLVIHYDPDHHPDISSLFVSLDTAGAPTAMPRSGGMSANGTDAHKPQTKLDEMTGAIEEEAEFLADHSALARSIVDSVKALDREIKRSTNNNIDLKILAPVGLAAFTFLEIGAAAATPMWITLAIFSLNHFVELRAHDGGDAPELPRAQN